MGVFTYASKIAIMAALGANEEPFLDTALLAGFSACQTFPPLLDGTIPRNPSPRTSSNSTLSPAPVHPSTPLKPGFNQNPLSPRAAGLLPKPTPALASEAPPGSSGPNGTPNLKQIADIVRHYRSGYTICVVFAEHPLVKATEYTEHFCRARCMIKFSLVLHAEEGGVLPLPVATPPPPLPVLASAPSSDKTDVRRNLGERDGLVGHHHHHHEVDEDKVDSLEIGEGTEAAAMMNATRPSCMFAAPAVKAASAGTGVGVGRAAALARRRFGSSLPVGRQSEDGGEHEARMIRRRTSSPSSYLFSTPSSLSTCSADPNLLQQFLPRRPTAIAIRQLLALSPPPSQESSPTLEQLLHSARLTSTELPIRLSHRVADFRALLFIVASNLPEPDHDPRGEQTVCDRARELLVGASGSSLWAAAARKGVLRSSVASTSGGSAAGTPKGSLFSSPGGSNRGAHTLASAQPGPSSSTSPFSRISDDTPHLMGQPLPDLARMYNPTSDLLSSGVVLLHAHSILAVARDEIWHGLPIEARCTRPTVSHSEKAKQRNLRQAMRSTGKPQALTISDLSLKSQQALHFAYDYQTTSSNQTRFTL
ncbi:unnamed protein product [Tilletia controversa]|uniref:Branched-chain alpha-ketoacid dehydrogenase kinase/Pyruvate dehydrogenase kinase N-terminal domain-containing protein n=4 Tax=Tilletia TaxID=13289 RepID=A0A8X7MVT9_9BASI|nr:hypothetical protein CF336_g5849 [Tilletia laevis]KAE8202731.1 hypothetical protein CF328_g2044 [Tilletia controversa]CAD6942653.1 unnamed protein product [Tilletia caries]KAE8202342.1 hypothetical protein CF335_g3459 [Tilletia laevis]KAE8251994.1 hypothetical protein A4X06_0g2456 [Tilletia controversa]